jgi:acyl-CoA synthetase (AMP-forming)/AMP-acid ligase II
MPVTLAELYDRAVLHGGDRIALSDADKSLSYAQLGDLSHRLAASLAVIGLRQNDRVAFLMSNCVEYVVCESALARLGATRIPLAVLLAEDDHVYMLNVARCRALFYHASLLDRVVAMSGRLDCVEHFICVGDASALPAGHQRLSNLCAEPVAAPVAAPVDIEDIASIYFTGGTTGRPKGVMLSHRSWFHTYCMEMLEFGLGWRETFLFATPMTHAGGCLILPVLLRQGRCVVVDRFEAARFTATALREQVTASLVVPTMLYQLLEYAEAAGVKATSLQNVLYGAAPIAPERLKRAIEIFGPIFTQFFGQTEAPMALTSLPRADHVVANEAREIAVLSSAGRASYSTKIRLLNDEGVDVKPGEAGEIVVSAPNLMSGYLDDPQGSAAAVRRGWLHTGDIARRDCEGLITIVDRKKDMIISGGFNIYPREIEDVLFEHPGVRQAAVIGAPDEKWGEHVKAVVVLRPGASASAAELTDFVRCRKGALMAPKTIDFVDAIPLTNLGKIDKKALRASYWAGRERGV